MYFQWSILVAIFQELALDVDLLWSKVKSKVKKDEILSFAGK
jgi:hypothetical protein